MNKINKILINILNIINKKRIKILKYKTNYFNLKFHNTRRKSFTFLYIFNLLGIEIPDNNEPILGFAFSVFTLNLIALFSFISILGYFTSIYLINKYDVETKFSEYPWIIKFIKYFEKSSVIFIIIEVIFVIFSLVFLIILSLVILGIIIF